MSRQEEYTKIMEAWNRNASMSDMYHMILEWMEVYQQGEMCVEAAEAVQDWLRRAEDGDETNDLVEEFVYGSRYAILRQRFDKE